MLSTLMVFVACSALASLICFVSGAVPACVSGLKRIPGLGQLGGPTCGECSRQTKPLLCAVASVTAMCLIAQPFLVRPIANDRVAWIEPLPVEWDPTRDGEAAVNLLSAGYRQYHAGEYDKAITAFKRAISLGTAEQGTAWFYLGLSLQKKHCWYQAIEAYCNASSSSSEFTIQIMPLLEECLRAIRPNQSVLQTCIEVAKVFQKDGEKRQLNRGAQLEALYKLACDLDIMTGDQNIAMPLLRWKEAINRCMNSGNNCDTAEEHWYTRQAVRAARALKQPAKLVPALHHLAQLEETDSVRKLALLQEAVHLSENAPLMTPYRLTCRYDLALFYYQHNDRKKALELCQRNIQEGSQLNAPSPKAQLAQEQPALSLSLYLSALCHHYLRNDHLACEQFRNVSGELKCLRNAGICACLDVANPSAESLLKELIAADKADHWVGGLHEDYINLGLLYLRMHAYEQAASCFAHVPGKAYQSLPNVPPVRSLTSAKTEDELLESWMIPQSYFETLHDYRTFQHLAAFRACTLRNTGHTSEGDALEASLLRTVRKDGWTHWNKVPQGKTAKEEIQFMEDIQTRMHLYWPDMTNLSGKKVTCKITFQVKQDGQISAAKVKVSSGDAQVDRNCLDAIEQASPLKMLPHEPSWPIAVDFEFKGS